ncbi:hypothetical protein ACFFK7_07895 [Pseudoalteromonas xiamenensis]|uniref:hypothetical protein n=1 Tax=Pseudoalteromonas xiamenensis TaxID=882626 RepID=UPI0035ED47D6
MLQIKKPQFGNSILVNQCGYLADKLYRFVWQDEELNFAEADESFEPKILILSRARYTESQGKLPFDNKKQVSRFFKLASNQELNKKVTTLIHKCVEGQTVYTQWRWDKDYCKGWLTLPESLLFVQSSSDLVEVNTNDRTLWCTKSDNGVHSILANVLVNSAERFLVSIGAAAKPVIKVEASSRPILLLNNFFHVGLNNLASFINIPSKAFIEASFKKGLKTTSMILAGYLLFSSIFVLAKQAWLTHQLEGLSAEVNTALTLQNEVEKQVALYTSGKQLLNELPEQSPFLQIFAEIVPKAQLTNIRFEAGRYELRGQAQQATEILSFLVNHPSVKEAKFDYPTRKSRDKDVFVISFTVKQAGENS